MAKNLGSKCKLCRRAGEKLFLKGDRCASSKCAIVRKPYAPGAHGQTGGGRGLSEFGKQLAEKQKLKRLYSISEQQFRRHLGDAQKQTGVVGDNLIIGLEMRLDNIIYRLGLAVSRSQARQLVSHGMFKVNNKPLNVPSVQLRIGDEIQVKEQKIKNSYFKELQTIIKKKHQLPGWLSFDTETMTAKILSSPDKDEVGAAVDMPAVLEFYSR
ncbi:MAG: 30S ribosomal protein S4 [Patescibacteria group bacterium]|nr:30S ribosomal protein S4 [Patescibacteria group bacterium]